MKLMPNPYRGAGIVMPEMADVPMPSIDAARPQQMLARCPEAGQTPLAQLSGFVGAGEVYIKDERTRMGLGSFKALGAAYVIAHHAALGQVEGRTYVCASAGNHGLSVAAGAAAFGAHAVIYLAESVPEAFAERLRLTGAEVVRAGAEYEASMTAAAQAAEAQGWTLLSDSSWPGYYELPHRLMEGYLTLAAEAGAQLGAVIPTHILLQAGVGGLAASVAAYARHLWGDAPQIIVVEPEFAPALADSIQAGRAVVSSGPVSDMGRLDCKEPSLIALKGLARDADIFATISEAEAAAVLPLLAREGLASTTSGAAGLAALLAGIEGIDAQARVLCVLSEAP